MLANYWMHCGPGLYDGREIDEERRFINIPYFKEKGYSEREIRYCLLTTNYRKPVSFSEENLLLARKSLSRLDGMIQALMHVTKGGKSSEIDGIMLDIEKGFIEAMDDDMNTADAIAAIFELVRDINIHVTGEASVALVQTALDLLGEMTDVLGFLNREKGDIDAEIEALIESRQEARKNKDWAEADKIRDELKARGIVLEDTPQGVKWSYAKN